MSRKLMRKAEAVRWIHAAHAAATIEDCILWPQGVDKDGYGQTIWMTDGQKQWIRIHRFSLELASGPAPNGKPFALHSCHTPRCINPLHLRWGTALDNNHERDQAGRGKKSRLTIDQVVALSQVHGKHREAMAKDLGISYPHARTLILQLRAGVTRHMR